MSPQITKTTVLYFEMNKDEDFKDAVFQSYIYPQTLNLFRKVMIIGLIEMWERMNGKVPYDHIYEVTITTTYNLFKPGAIQIRSLD